MISFQNGDITFVLREKKRLRKWLGKLIKAHGSKEGEIGFVFCSDDYILEANRRYLQHDTYTDIITFDSCAGDTISGDILISIDRVRDNAGKFGVTPAEELHRVMAHGVLHLLGFRDKSRKDRERMRTEEDNALRLLARVR